MEPFDLFNALIGFIAFVICIAFLVSFFRLCANVKKILNHNEDHFKVYKMHRLYGEDNKAFEALKLAVFNDFQPIIEELKSAEYPINIGGITKRYEDIKKYAIDEFTKRNLRFPTMEDLKKL